MVAFWVIYAGVLALAEADARVPLRVFFPCGTVSPVSQALALFSRQNLAIEIEESVDKGKPLAQRFRKGEACDVFIGRPEEMQPLLKGGLLDKKQHAPIAAQILCLVVPAGNPAGLKSLQDLTSPRLKQLGLAPSNSHPGKYTRQALKRLRLAGKIKAREIIPKDADELPALVGKGDVQAAILFRSCVPVVVDAKGNPSAASKIRIIEDLPASSHDPIMLSAAVSRKSAHSAEAQRLVEFLATPQARSYFMENGFRAPAADK
jgi:molybdate transport system substrate-binding protein